jgi:cell wall-associated NlpC family hydrolase
VQGALIAHQTPTARVGQFRRLALALVALVLALTVISLETPAVAWGRTPEVAAATRASQAARVVRIARAHVGARFRMGAEGHQYFDCSGFVYRVYRMAGLLDRIGGGRKGATAYYNWFKRRGLVSRRNPKPGDLIAYAHRGQKVIPHVAIYIGNGRAISALISPWGVRSHRVNSIGIPFKGYLHVRMGR